MAGIRHTGSRRPPGRQPLGRGGVRGGAARPPRRGEALAVELVTANSQVVRALVADGRADVGVAASRPDHTPNPGVRESRAGRRRDRLRGAPGHPWARRGRCRRKRFLATPMVVRDPSSNARWTVDAVLAEPELQAAEPLMEAATPRAALAEARTRRAPVLLSRHVLAQTDFIVVDVDGLAFPRSYVLVTPGLWRADRRGARADRRIREYVDLAALTWANSTTTR